MKPDINLKDQIPEELLYRFEPKESWLTHDSSLHGVGHMARVFILQELICNRLEQEGIGVDREATRFAAMAHDVGRQDDDIDPEHGTRSAEWMRVNLADQMSPAILSKATYIVHWHVPSDSRAPEVTTELKVLKDADALDRVRLGDLDPSYLRTEAAKGLVDIAQHLFELSLPVHPGQEKEAFDDVLRASKKLGLVQA